MSASNSFENSNLLHIFQNANIANIGNATGLRGASTAGNLYVSLHTSDPGEAGNQSTSEATYTGYSRVTVVRSSSGWTVSGSTCTNATIITFGQCTANSNVVTYFGIGTAATGTGTLLISGILTPSFTVGVGVTPRFAIGGLSVDVE